jgi:hypothetical protein
LNNSFLFIGMNQPASKVRTRSENVVIPNGIVSLYQAKRGFGSTSAGPVAACSISSWAGTAGTILINMMAALNADSKNFRLTVIPASAY